MVSRRRWYPSSQSGLPPRAGRRHTSLLVLGGNFCSHHQEDTRRKISVPTEPMGQAMRTSRLTVLCVPSLTLWPPSTAGALGTIAFALDLPPGRIARRTPWNTEHPPSSAPEMEHRSLLSICPRPVGARSAWSVSPDVRRGIRHEGRRTASPTTCTRSPVTFGDDQGMVRVPKGRPDGPHMVQPCTDPFHSGPHRVVGAVVCTIRASARRVSSRQNAAFAIVHKIPRNGRYA